MGVLLNEPGSTRFADGLELVECPRWYGGALWVSDMWAHCVYRFDLDGRRHVVHRFDDDEDPGGIGWLPDGTMLVVGMLGRVVYRVGAGRAEVHADLRDVAPFELNDMVVAPDGAAYVSQFGYPFARGDVSAIAPTSLIRVGPDGDVAVAAAELMVPNGVAVTADGSEVLVAESAASRISRFRVAADGTLEDRRLQPVPVTGDGFAAPDGICLDRDGAIWAADPINHRVVRFDQGSLVEEVPFDALPLACAFGGEDRGTLFVCVNEVYAKADRRATPTGAIRSLVTATAGSGRP